MAKLDETESFKKAEEHAKAEYLAERIIELLRENEKLKCDLAKLKVELKSEETEVKVRMGVDEEIKTLKSKADSYRKGLTAAQSVIKAMERSIDDYEYTRTN